LLISAAGVRGATAPPTTRESAAGGTSGPAAPQDLQQQVSQLRSELEQSKAQQQALQDKLAAQSQQAPPTTQPSNPVKFEQHSDNFLDALPTNVTFDLQKGLRFTSDDGDFMIHPFTLVQIRNVTNIREDAKAGSTDTENGFEIRRMQLGADGNLFSPDITFRIFIQTERSGGEAELFDAWLKYHFHDTPFYIEGGQFKSPFAHEQMIFDRTMMAADRTLTDDILADGEAFSEGAMAIFDNDDFLRAKLQVTNGYGTNDVNFEDPPARPASFGLGTREEFKFMGNWRDYDQFTSLGDSQDLLVAGFGAGWSQAHPANLVRETGDVQWNHGQLGVYGGYVGLYTAHNGAAGDTFDYGPILQVSYLLDPRHLELFGRYDYLKLDGKEFAAGTNTNVDEITAGINYYFYGQNLKLTTDATYLPNGSPVDDNGSGVLLNSGKGEVVLRVQMQLSL
jgi:hypothetical protein